MATIGRVIPELAEYEDYGFGAWFRAKTGRYHVFVYGRFATEKAGGVDSQHDFASMEGVTAFLDGLEFASRIGKFQYEVITPAKYFEDC